MKFIYSKLYKIILLFLLIVSCHKTDKNTTPNVIFILTDDLGFADLSSYGSKIIDTPNLDLMASQGALLSSYYATQAVCSASRASISSSLLGAAILAIVISLSVIAETIPSGSFTSDK
jgi:hypothetical protein